MALREWASLWVLQMSSFFAKEPLIIGLFCGKWPIKIRHPVMCGVVRMSCVMRFSARCSIDYIYSIDYIQMSMELTKKKKNVLCLASTNWAVLWDRPLATTLTVHTNEYRGCVWKWVNSIYMCDELPLSCAMRSSACDYGWLRLVGLEIIGLFWKRAL